MEKKFTIALLISFIVLIIALIFFILSQTQIPSKSPLVPIKNCSTLVNNGQGKINIVFLGEKDLAQSYFNFLMSFPPFDKYSTNFNAYFINTTADCQLYKGIAILCYNKNTIQQASQCPNDIIVALDNNQPSQIRSSSYMNVISLNTNQPLTVISHEFGHAFVNFAEEYTPADIAKGSQNCQSSCNLFNQSCFQGCSNENYYRSIDNGIMRTLGSDTYGDFDSQLIITKINQLLSKTKTTGNAIVTDTQCSTQSYYQITANLTNNQINIIDRTKQTGCIGTSGSGPFTYSINLNNNQTIPGTNFNPELIFTDAPGTNQISGQTYQSDQNFILKVPIIDNSKSLDISENNTLISEINLYDIGSSPCLQ